MIRLITGVLMPSAKTDPIRTVICLDAIARVALLGLKGARVRGIVFGKNVQSVIWAQRPFCVIDTQNTKSKCFKNAICQIFFKFKTFFYRN